MRKRTHALTVALALAAGWLGGSLGTRPIFSQGEARPDAQFGTLQAVNLQLIEPNGNMVGQLCVVDGEPHLQLCSPTKRWLPDLPGPDGRRGVWVTPVLGTVAIHDDMQYISLGDKDAWAAVMSASKQSAYFEIRNPQGEVVWRAP